MERICFILELKPGQEQEYERRHNDVWAELVRILRESGVNNYSLFRRGLEVIGYAECEPDAASAFGKVGKTEINSRWSKWFEDVIDRQFDQNGELLIAPEVWHID